MSAAAVLAQLRRDFTYRLDGGLDAWRVPAHLGPVRGDCEEFALALAFRLAGRSWPRFFWHLASLKSVIWQCTTAQGVGHAALWHRGAGWADNIFPTWGARCRHKRRFPYVLPLLAIKLALGALVARVGGAKSAAE